MKIKILLTLLFSVLLLSLNLSHAANFGSSYATIAAEHCTIITSQTGEQGTRQKCPRFKGIDIETVRDEQQQHIVLSRNYQQYPLIFKDPANDNISRTTLGPTIEWRQQRGRVIGLIMRVNVFSASNKKRSFLVVSKVTDQEICIIGSVPPQRNQNKQARNVADGAANKPCISTPLSQDKVLETLVGSWVEPVPGRPREVQGFTLYADGKADSISMKTLRYQKWRVEGNQLILTTQNIVSSWAASEDESYTFSFCENNNLCLTAGGITQIYKRQQGTNTNTNARTQPKPRDRDPSNNTRFSNNKRIDIGMMIGRQYADHCSFLKPLDLRNFIYKDDNSWRFILSSNPQSRSARISLNNRIENLELINIEEDFYAKTMKERYRVKGDRNTTVIISKTETNNFRNYKRYKGSIRVERNGEAREISVLGDCRL